MHLGAPATRMSLVELHPRISQLRFWQRASNWEAPRGARRRLRESKRGHSGLSPAIAKGGAWRSTALSRRSSFVSSSPAGNNERVVSAGLYDGSEAVCLRGFPVFHETGRAE
jgi:hypothetical protein